MVYLDSFIRGYCHECKKKSKCEKDCDGLQEAVKSLNKVQLDCNYCAENIYPRVPTSFDKCIDCRYHACFTFRDDLHKVAMGGER